MPENDTEAKRKEGNEPKGFFQTIPGILTAIAGIITALTGLLVALHQSERSH